MKVIFYNVFELLSSFKKKEINIVILFSIIIRIPVIFVFGDTGLEHE